MLYEKFKVLEGINIYEKDPLIYIKSDVYKKLELERAIDKYIKVCSEFKIKTEVNEKIFKNKIEVIIKSENLYISKEVLDKIMTDYSEDINLNHLKDLIEEDWAKKLKSYALKMDIPYMYINKEELQLGYGNQGLRVRKEEYLNNDKSQLIKRIEKDLIKSRGMIPIISVTGTNGKTTTVKLIHKILLELGYSSGLSSTGGIYNKDKIIKTGDTTGFYSAREVLKQEDIDIAVLESARGGIVKKGLGYKNAKVAVITSLSEDHIGQDEIRTLDDLLKIKSLVIDELDKDGIIVIKAIPILYNKVRHKKNVVLFDYEKNSIIEEHVKNKGIAYYVDNNYIVKNTKGDIEELICVEDIPFAFKGVSKSNLKNVIAAIIAVSKIHNSIDEIIGVVKNIQCDTKTNLGRQNIIDFKDFNIILDYGHNKEAFEEVFSIAKNLKLNRIIGLITAAGDREDKYIKELGEVASRYCDYIVIKEHSDKRGRILGEVAKLLQNGAMENGFNPNNILIEIEESKAIEKIFKIATKGDIIVCFSQFLNESLPVINKYRLEKNMNIIEINMELYH